MLKMVNIVSDECSEACLDIVKLLLDFIVALAGMF